MSKGWRWAVVLAVAAAIVGWLLLRDGRGDSAGVATATTTAPIERRTLVITVEASGVVEPVRVVEVKSRASGEVRQVFAETGAEVEVGALLAEIDPRDVTNALEQAEADVTSARVRARVATAQVDRVRRLLDEGVVPAQELDAAEDAAAAAESAVLRAETNIELARERRGDVTIRAPIAGTVIERQAEPGQIIASATANVSGGTTLFRMADLASMRIRASIDETDIGRIRPGQPVRVTVEAFAGRSFAGEVEKVEPQAIVEQNVTQFPVLVRLANHDRSLLPGMTAEIALEVARREDVLAVPNGAVVGARDVDAAAAALGVPAEAARAALRGDAAAATAASPAPPIDAMEAECRALRARIREVGGPADLSEAERARLRECRQRFARDAAVSVGDDGGTTAAGSEERFGLLFVAGPGGPEPRRVRFGLSDWEYTEIVEGVSEGDAALLVTVARIQSQQRELEQRVRERAGGGLTGANSARPPRGR